MIRWEQLAWLEQAPRTASDDQEKLYSEIIDKPWPFVFWGGGVKGWRKRMNEGRLVRLGVIQANQVLFSRETAELAPAVLCFFPDPAENQSDAAIAQLLHEVARAREADTVPSDCQAFFAQLEDEESDFSELVVPATLTGGRRAVAFVSYLEPERLPGGCIPASRILPGFWLGKDVPEIVPPRLYR